MSLHTWESPEIYQIQTQDQANLNDWSEETGKKRPIKVIKTARRVQPSDSLSLPVCSSTLLFSSQQTLYLFHHLPSLWELFSAKLRSQGLVTEDGLHLWQGTKAPFQAAAGRDHSHFTILLWDNTSSVNKQKPPKTKEANPVHEIWS